MSDTRSSNSNVEIVRGHHPGVIEAAVEMQSRYYTRTPGFNEDYESTLAKGLAKIEPSLDGKEKEVWIARCKEKIVGTIFVIGGRDTDQNHARLTSFVVDDGFRGVGTGRRLLTEAIKFVDEQGFEETRLWTFKGSDVAIHMYESFGFILEKQSEGEYFGKQLTVQLFIRKHQGTMQS